MSEENPIACIENLTHSIGEQQIVGTDALWAVTSLTASIRIMCNSVI